MADGSVNDIPDAELIGRVVRGFRSSRRVGAVPRWEAVSRAFALGSTYSAQLCRRYGQDPEEKVNS